MVDRIKAAVEYPIGHRRRRAEGIPLLEQKFERALGTRYAARRAAAIAALLADQERLEATPAHELMAPLAA